MLRISPETNKKLAAAVKSKDLQTYTQLVEAELARFKQIPIDSYIGIELHNLSKIYEALTGAYEELKMPERVAALEEEHKALVSTHTARFQLDAKTKCIVVHHAAIRACDNEIGILKMFPTSHFTKEQLTVRQKTISHYAFYKKVLTNREKLFIANEVSGDPIEALEKMPLEVLAVEGITKETHNSYTKEIKAKSSYFNAEYVERYIDEHSPVEQQFIGRIELYMDQGILLKVIPIAKYQTSDTRISELIDDISSVTDEWDFEGVLVDRYTCRESGSLTLLVAMPISKLFDLAIEERHKLQKEVIESILPMCTERCKKMLRQEYPFLTDLLPENQNTQKGKQPEDKTHQYSQAQLVSQFSALKTQESSTTSSTSQTATPSNMQLHR